MATISGNINETSNEASKSFLDFINDTKEGKYTEQKPELIQITYQRINTQEDKNTFPTEDMTLGLALFGLTF